MPRRIHRFDPGVHINLILVFILSISPAVLNYISPVILIVVIIAMSITHTFLDTIPSTFLGAPDPSNALSALPAHRLLLMGRGYEAIFLTLVGSFGSLILAIASLPLLAVVIKLIYPLLKKYLGYILILVVLLLFIREKRRFWPIIVFFLAGILGIATLGMPNLNEPLFPMLSGLFGVSLIFLSMKMTSSIPPQTKQVEYLSKKTGFKAIATAVIAGSICSFMPGLGPSQAAALSTTIAKATQKGFLILVGGLNTVNMVISFLTLMLIDKARNGSVIAISRLLEEFTFNHLLLAIGVALVVACLAIFLALSFTNLFSKYIVKLNYKILCLSIIILIIGLVIYISGLLGLLVLTVATFIGFIPQLKNVPKSHLMGCLLLPVILHFIL